DLCAGVIASGPRNVVGELGQGEIDFAGTERGAVEPVNADAVPGSVGDYLLDGRRRALRVIEPDVAQTYIPGHRLKTDPQSRRITQAAVGVGETVEQIGMVIIGCGLDDCAVAGHDVHFGDRFVRQAVSEARRFNAQTRDRSAQGDCPKLRHDIRNEPVRQCGVHEVFVSAHALDVGDPFAWIDLDHTVEAVNV